LGAIFRAGFFAGILFTVFALAAGFLTTFGAAFATGFAATFAAGFLAVFGAVFAADFLPALGAALRVRAQVLCD